MLLKLKKQLFLGKIFFKKNGFFKTCLAILKILVSPLFQYKKVLMMHIPKNADFRKQTSPQNIVLKPLQVSQADALAEFSPYLSKKEILWRLKNKHQCFMAEDNGKIMSYGWIAIGKVYIPVIEKEMNFSEETVYFYNVYTDPEYSFLKLGPLFISQMHEIFDAKDNPYPEAWMILDIDTKISVRPYKRLTGADKIILIKFLKILFFKKYKFMEIDDKTAVSLCREK